ncbi:PAS domain-containing sensor histidine kinase [Nonomuraea wenchangensis]|uniref:PAS domain-containing sensor histidine kinase n=1 Tax=Nonomuraea wenchangensis TaxID=568860 RepID=UPI0034269381
MIELDCWEVFDAAPVALSVLSPGLDIVAVNRVHERILGRSRRECVGRNIFEVFPGGSWPQGVEALRSLLRRVLDGVENEAEVLLLQRFDVETPGNPDTAPERYWSVACSPLQGPDGTTCAVIVRMEEVTSFVERMREESRSEPSEAGWTHAAAVEAQLFARTAELQEANLRLRESEARERQISDGLREMVRRQRQVVADASHDLRGPVTGLRARLEDALADPESDTREILQAVVRDADRLGAIIGDMLELARMETGAPAPAEPVDLALLIRGELAHRISKATTVTCLDPGVVVNASPVRLARILDNLLANAERHTRSRIEVSLTAHDGEAVLEVTDDGPGIPDADKERVFIRFFRRPDARLRDPGGTGLGLPISRHIAEAYGGTLNAADRTDGGAGARMILRLPLLTPGRSSLGRLHVSPLGR